MKTSERLYRVLLRAYPRDFRDEYADEMASVFRLNLDEGYLSAWSGAISDVLFGATREHAAVFGRDLAYAFRTWRQTPVLPLVAITALAFGIGANTTMFSVVHAVLLRPLPARDPGRLVRVFETNVERGFLGTASIPNYVSWTEEVESLELAAWSTQILNWAGENEAIRLEALAATASFAPVLGVPIDEGRWFEPAEEQPGNHRAVVLSNGFWQRWFGGGKDVLDQTLVLNGLPYRIVGVASPEFSVPREPDLWVPKLVDPSDEVRDDHYINVVGRVRDGFRADQATVELAAVARQLEDTFPETNTGWSTMVVPLDRSLIPADVRTALWLLFGAVGVVLLIACANISNLLLVRSAARAKEMAIRTALGAGKGRLVRQLLTESALLSLAGGLAGIVLAAAVLGVTRGFLIGIVPRADTITLDPAVLGFATASVLLTTMLFSLAPLGRLRSTWSLALAVQDTSRTPRYEPRSRLRTALVVGQIAMMTLLLVSGTLLARSLVSLTRVPLGIDTDRVVTARVTLPRNDYPNGQAAAAMLARLTGSLESQSGIEAAGISTSIPLSGDAYTLMGASPANEPSRILESQWRLVDAGYFEVLRIPMIAGRPFGPGDGAESRRVFIVNESLARTLYGPDAVGQQLRLTNGMVGTVVGVVGDVRLRDFTEAPDHAVYFPVAQFGFPQFAILVRTSRAVEDTAAVIRGGLAELAPGIPAYDVQPMDYWLEQSVSDARIRTWALGLFGAAAIVLSVLGLYGVLSYVVALRYRELGIRMAVGARPIHLIASVVGEGLRMAVVGVAIGLGGAALASTGFEALLFGVTPGDPVTFLAVAGFVTAIALLASLVPALRASRADPLVALRGE